ncbi:MAG: hypothetical protein FWD92_06805 [Methanomassiliicoccaceae archaeon]|nr:hypothetical protein [Methanomassiliicoccaceae archaeon]
MDKKYMKRVMDDHLKIRLSSSGAVLIEGAKWCGKTRTAKEHAVSAVYMHDPDLRENMFTSFGNAYEREDGVLVVPIGCLKN